MHIRGNGGYHIWTLRTLTFGPFKQKGEECCVGALPLGSWRTMVLGSSGLKDEAHARVMDIRNLT